VAGKQLKQKVTCGHANIFQPAFTMVENKFEGTVHPAFEIASFTRDIEELLN
jgi:hypothetical protein